MHYDYKTGDLIAKLVPSVEHHALALHLAYSLLDAVNPNVGKHSYFFVRCATFRGPRFGKTRRPLPERTFRGDWLTMVMEVGVHGGWKMDTVPAGAGATDILGMASSISVCPQEDNDDYVASDDLILRFEDPSCAPRHHFLRETLS